MGNSIGDLNDFSNVKNENTNSFNKTVSNFVNKGKRDSLNLLSGSMLQNIGNSILNSNNLGNFDASLLHNNSNNMNLTQNKINKSFIKSSNKVNLRATMDTLDLIPEYDEKELDDAVPIIKNINLFKNNKISDLKSDNKNKYLDNNTPDSLEDVNQFNKTILGTIKWGDLNNKLSSKENSTSTSFFKPQKKEIEREIGISIQNTKLPRNRLPTKAFERKNLNKINKIDNLKKKEENSNTLFNSTSENFLKAESFSKVFNQILGKNK